MTNSFSRRKPMTSKAMKLGGKSKDVDSFVDQLKSEGEHVTSEIPAPRSSMGSGKTISKAPPSTPAIKMERYMSINKLKDVIRI